jgi:hypothetical protein
VMEHVVHCSKSREIVKNFILKQLKCIKSFILLNLKANFLNYFFTW